MNAIKHGLSKVGLPFGKHVADRAQWPDNAVLNIAKRALYGGLDQVRGTVEDLIGHTKEIEDFPQSVARSARRVGDDGGDLRCSHLKSSEIERLRIS